MNRIKCNRCGLINVSSDQKCRRCEVNLHSSENAPPAKPSAMPDLSDLNNSSSMKFLVILLILVVASVGYYKLFYLPNAEHAESERIGQQKSTEMKQRMKYESDRKDQEEMQKYKDRFGR